MPMRATLPFVLGTNHTLAPGAVRERMVADPDQARAFLDGVTGRTGVREYIVLSTCGRFEVYATAADPARAQRLLLAAAARSAGLSIRELLLASRVLTGASAVTHLHRVAAGLESAVQGEAQILGQVRNALVRNGNGNGNGGAGPVLHRLFQSAVLTGKRVRSETGLGRGAVSLASAALDMVRVRAGGLEGMRALVIGAGETGRLVARLLRDGGVAELSVANRTEARGRKLAALLDARVVDFADVAAFLPQVDVVVVAVNSRVPVLTAAQLPTNGNRVPPFFIDLSHPSAIDPAIGARPGTERIDLDAIQTRVMAARTSRASQVPAAEALVAAGVADYLGWLASRATLPVVRALREDVLQRAQREAGRHARGLDVRERERFEQFARALARTLLHRPTRALREVDPHTEEGRALLRSAGLLFGIDPVLPAAPAPPGRDPSNSRAT
jgi:glutamyl-tRNA reductase